MERTNPYDLVESLTDRRVNLGLTKSAMARLIGVRRETLWTWEEHRFLPLRGNMYRWIKAVEDAEANEQIREEDEDA